MLKSQKIMIIVFCLIMLFSIPALAAQSVGGYVSNTPVAAGPNASIGEVWMRHGGARLQYDALMGSIQTNTNGVKRKDPVTITSLPPLYPQKYSKRKTKKSTAKAPMSKKVMPKVHSSPKPTIQSSSSSTPYSGAAPVAPAAPAATQANSTPPSRDIVSTPSVSAVPQSAFPAAQQSATMPAANPPGIAPR